MPARGPYQCPVMACQRGISGHSDACVAFLRSVAPGPGCRVCDDPCGVSALCKYGTSVDVRRVLR